MSPYIISWYHCSQQDLNYFLKIGYGGFFNAEIYFILFSEPQFPRVHLQQGTKKNTGNHFKIMMVKRKQQIICIHISHNQPYIAKKISFCKKIDPILKKNTIFPNWNEQKKLNENKGLKLIKFLFPIRTGIYRPYILLQTWLFFLYRSCRKYFICFER